MKTLADDAASRSSAAFQAGSAAIHSAVEGASAVAHSAWGRARDAVEAAWRSLEGTASKFWSLQLQPMLLAADASFHERSSGSYAAAKAAIATAQQHVASAARRAAVALSQVLLRAEAAILEQLQMREVAVSAHAVRQALQGSGAALVAVLVLTAVRAAVRSVRRARQQLVVRVVGPLHASQLAALRQATGYTFRKPQLAASAFDPGGEALDWLGGSVLSLLVAESAYAELEESGVADLQRAQREALCPPALARKAADLGLMEFLEADGQPVIGRGQWSQKHRATLHAAAARLLSAFVGALFVDSGFSLQDVRNVFVSAATKQPATDASPASPSSTAITQDDDGTPPPKEDARAGIGMRQRNSEEME